MIVSAESEKLERYINEKISYLKTVKNPYHSKKLQEEVIFLKNSILPIVLNETTLFYGEITKWLERYIREAVTLKYDAVLMLLPISDNVNDVCKIGVLNPKRQKFGKEEIENIDISIESMGVGRREIEIYNFPML